MKASINRVMLAGTGSGCGKTTLTCAILGALKEKNISTAAFKCGPDYIDPMFHSRVTGVPCVNIDPFLCGEKAAKYLFAQGSQGYDFSLVEGVMGFYDGLGGNTTANSSYAISELLQCPVVLVVSCKGLSLSLAAVVKGYQSLYPNRIGGVILNHVSAASYPMYKEIVVGQTGFSVLGYLPWDSDCSIESRHLGLVTAGELSDLEKKMNTLAKTALQTLDLDGLLALGQSAPKLAWEDVPVQKEAPVTLAVAMDAAFCFYYSDSLKLLERMGATLKPFSPLKDTALPEGVGGVFLGGGYPELYLDQLSQNHSMLGALRAAHQRGMPLYGECGGYLYLGKSLQGKPLAGLIPMDCRMTNRLQNFGYVHLTANETAGLLVSGESLPAHEFHYSVSDSSDLCLTAQKVTGRSWQGGYQKDGLFALYPHLHFYGCMDFARRYLNACRAFDKGRCL